MPPSCINFKTIYFLIDGTHGKSLVTSQDVPDSPFRFISNYLRKKEVTLPEGSIVWLLIMHPFNIFVICSICKYQKLIIFHKNVCTMDHLQNTFIWYQKYLEGR